MDRARRTRAEGAAHRLESGVLARASRIWPRSCPIRAPSTTCTRSWRVPRTSTTCSARPPTAASSPAWWRGRRVRHAVPPREVRARRPAPARRTSRRCAPRGRMILLPAVDIRDGRAVRLRQGRFDDETVYADEPAGGRPLVRGGGRPLAARGGPRRRSRGRAGEPPAPGADRRRAGGAGAVRRRPAVDRLDPRRAGRRAPRAWWSARPPSPTPTSSSEALEDWGERVAVAVDVRGGRRVGVRAGRERPRCCPSS